MCKFLGYSGSSATRSHSLEFVAKPVFLSPVLQKATEHPSSAISASRRERTDRQEKHLLRPAVQQPEGLPLCDFLCFENITRAGGFDLKFGVLFEPIGDVI